MAKLLPTIAALALLAGCQSQVSSTAGTSGATLYSAHPEEMLKPAGEAAQERPELVLKNAYQDRDSAGSLIANE